MRALYGMFMKNWAILGFDKPIVYSRYNIGGVGCNYRFRNLFLGMWCVIEYGIIQHTNTPTITLTNYGVGLLTKLGFCRSIEFNTMV